MDFFNDILKGQKMFGEDISQIVNFLLLTITYFLGVGLTSVLAKIFGKHFLKLKIDEEEDSYWTELNLTKKPIGEYYRQF